MTEITADVTILATEITADVATGMRGVAGVDGVDGDGAVIGDVVTDGTAGSVLFVDSSANLAQDNTNLFWDDDNNRLGIGTPTPNAKLEVAGDISADDEVEAYNGRDLLRYNLMMSN